MAGNEAVCSDRVPILVYSLKLELSVVFCYPEDAVPWSSFFPGSLGRVSLREGPAAFRQRRPSRWGHLSQQVERILKPSIPAGEWVKADVCGTLRYDSVSGVLSVQQSNGALVTAAWLRLGLVGHRS